MKIANNFPKPTVSAYWLFLLIILFAPLSSVAQMLPNLVWAQNILPSPLGMYMSGSAGDPSNNIYTGGSFSGRTDFNPGTAPGDTLYLQGSAYSASAFLTKMDAQGNLLWARGITAFGNSNQYHEIQQIQQSVTDESGNCYFWIQTNDSTFYIENGLGAKDTVVNTAPNLTNNISRTFLIKFNPLGEVKWIKCIIGNIIGYRQGMITDQDNNVYISGTQTDSLIFDPGGWNYGLQGKSAFICKLDSLGNFLWVKQFGNGPTNLGIQELQIAKGADRSFFVTGKFSGDTLDFDPGSGVVNLQNSLGSAFLSKFDWNGNLIWTEAVGRQLAGQTGGQSFNQVITSDYSGNVFLAGNLTATFDFDPGPDSSILEASPDMHPFFILKFNPSGGLVWAKKFRDVVDTLISAGSGGAINAIASIATNHSGDVFCTGNFKQIMDFDPGSDSFLLTSSSDGGPDIFVAKLDASGNFNWAFGMGGTSVWATDKGVSVYVNDSDEIYTTGLFTGAADFDPGLGVYTLNANNQNAVFIQKLKDSPSTGISDKLLPKSALRLFPNPAHSEIYLQNEGSVSMESMAVYNVLGQIMAKQKEMAPYRYRLDVRNWVPGNYFVRIRLADGSLSQGKFEIRK